LTASLAANLLFDIIGIRSTTLPSCLAIPFSAITMKSTTIVVTAAIALASFGPSSVAFQPTSPLSITNHHHHPSPSSSTTLYEYIPSGFNKQSWAAFKSKETEAKKAKNLGRMGPKGFQSRSMQSFQEALERGEAEHLLPVFNAKQRIAKGELKEEDIPYMQRGEQMF